MFTPSLFPEDLDHILAHTRDDWEQLRGRRIFITGGTGFFGMWLLESFVWANQKLNLGAEALLLSREPVEFLKRRPHLAKLPSLTLHAGDVASFDFPDGHFSHVIHGAMAANAALNVADPLLMVDTVVAGTRRTLDFARHCKADKFLLVSSGAVYGRQPADMPRMPEEYCGGPDLLDPVNAHAESKRLAEHLCCLYSYSYKLKTTISRGFAFVGAYLPVDAHFAIGNFLRDALAGGPIAVGGDGTPIRSYMYAADLAIWMWRILFRGASCRAYNTGSDSEISIAELARLVAKTTAPGAEVRIARPAEPNRPRHVYVPDIRRAREELGLDVYIPLEEAIRRTGCWHRSRSGFPPDIE